MTDNFFDFDILIWFYKKISKFAMMAVISSETFPEFKFFLVTRIRTRLHDYFHVWSPSRTETGQAFSLTHVCTLSHYGLELFQAKAKQTPNHASRYCRRWGFGFTGPISSLRQAPGRSILSIFSVSLLYSSLSIIGFTTLLAPINSPSSSLCSLLVEFVFLGYYPLARGKRSQSWTTLVPGSAGSPAP